MFIDCEEMYLSNIKPFEDNFSTTFTIYNDSEIPLYIYFNCNNDTNICKINFLVNKEIIDDIHILPGFFHETVTIQYKASKIGEYEYLIDVINYHTSETTTLKLYTVVTDKGSIDGIKIESSTHVLNYNNGEYQLEIGDCYTNTTTSSKISITNCTPNLLDITLEKDNLGEVIFTSYYPEDQNLISNSVVNGNGSGGDGNDIDDDVDEDIKPLYYYIILLLSIILFLLCFCV